MREGKNVAIPQKINPFYLLNNFIEIESVQTFDYVIIHNVLLLLHENILSIRQ